MERNLHKEDDISMNERRRSLILLDGLPERLKCPLCDKIFKDPIQTIRGELACHNCYVTKQQNGMCPIDNQPISTGQWFTDKFKATEVNNLQCHCMNKDNGCQWVGKVSKIEGHYKDCLYEPEKCLICRKTLNDGESQEEHLKRCQRFHRKTKCPFQQYDSNFQPITVEEEWKQLHDGLKDLNKQIEHLNNQWMGIQSSIENIFMSLEKAKCTSRYARTSEIVVPDCSLSGLKRDFSAINSTVNEANLRQQLFENTSFDGRMIWKIDNFKNQMQQAVTDEVTALHSAPCFTSKYGYKFCGRLYLNGDDMGRSTHLSLFFVLMKSEYDNLLEWPFTKSVTLRVINQEDRMRSMEESFAGNRFSSSFQKPSRELNVASGCPLLVPKDELINGGFEKDNSMFIEMSVW